MIAALLAALLAPFSVRFTPEVRSTYLSLGKIVEDRPMQVTNLRLACDLGDFGRIGVRHWGVSSLGDRRHDLHRHLLYHVEFGPTWEHDLKLADDWSIQTDLTCSWTLYRGFRREPSNRTYRWWQLDEALVNPYVVPFVRLRRCVDGSDYLYCRLGVRRKFALTDGFYLTPELAVDGGNARNQTRVFGRRGDGDEIGAGFFSLSPRLEFGWRMNANCSIYAWIEQYEVLGAARAVNDRSGVRTDHNDWTHGGVGVRVNF